MEEQDVDALDDFFAKKDKKKKKSKSSKKVADLLPAPTSTPPNEANDSIGDQLADRVAETTLVDSLDPDTLKEKKKSRKKKDKEGSDAASKVKAHTYYCCTNYNYSIIYCLASFLFFLSFLRFSGESNNNK